MKNKIDEMLLRYGLRDEQEVREHCWQVLRLYLFS